MYLILKSDLIHPYLDKSNTRILGRREYVLKPSWSPTLTLVLLLAQNSLGHDNGSILGIPHRINDEVEEIEIIRKGLSSYLREDKR